MIPNQWGLFKRLIQYFIPILASSEASTADEEEWIRLISLWIDLVRGRPAGITRAAQASFPAKDCSDFTARGELIA